MITVKNLSKSFQGTNVLKGVSFKIEAGKLTTLLGENGSGKSTILGLLSGLELPDEGEVLYRHSSLAGINFPHIHDIFFVHEKLDYSFPMTMEVYIDLLKEGIPKWDHGFFLKMVQDRKIDLKKNFQNYSRGQKMQVALMIALASRSPILLLDEITSVIDVYGRKYFLDLIDQHVQNGHTVVMTTNVINELEFYTDNLIVIKDKGIALDKPVKDIPQQFIKVRRIKDGSHHPIFDHPSCIWAGVNSDKSVSYIVPSDVAKSFDIPSGIVDKRQSSLEDVFIYYFNQRAEKNENAA